MRNFNDVSELIKALIKKETSKVFVFAGAGSGKTYSLVQILNNLKESRGMMYAREGRTIGVITYTNAAVDEINSRIFYDPLFAVSTIHSFIWECIRYHQKEIKKIFLRIIGSKINELSDKIKVRPKADALKRDLDQWLSKKEKVERRNRFTYNPNGGNSEKNSLSHGEVIQIGSEMIKTHPKIQKVIAAQYPVILVDESQDTNKYIVEAMFELKKVCGESLCLIIIGDEKQRIYMDGVKGLSKDKSSDWDSVTLRTNYRSDDRIVKLGNSIASRIEHDAALDSRPGVEEGYVRLFLSPVIEDFNVQEEIERKVMERMSSITGDTDWKKYKAKILILEHKLAAVRLNFEDFFDTIYSVESYKTGFLDGKLSVMSVFKDLVLPLYNTLKASKEVGKNHNRLNIIKNHTNFNESLAETGESLNEMRSRYVKAIRRLEKALVEEQRIGNILKIIQEEKIYNLHHILSGVIMEEYKDVDGTEEERAWHKVLSLTISNVIRYYEYIGGGTRYGTHQGVKGLQFDRVLCIIDDMHAKGNTFSFEKLLGVKPLSKTDMKNREDGKEDTIDRTLRLFYVICTRAKKSLAIVAYTENPEKAKETAIENGWFKEDEIEIGLPE